MSLSTNEAKHAAKTIVDFAKVRCWMAACCPAGCLLAAAALYAAYRCLHVL